MKTKILQGWRWIFTMGSTVALLGCLDRTRETGAQTVVEPPVFIADTSDNETQIETKPDSTSVHVAIPPANLSPGLNEIVKLAQSGVSESVLMAYVEKSNRTFNPTVDEIVYLKDIGVSDSVVASMVRHESATGQASTASSNLEIIENKIAPAQNPAEPGLTSSAAPSYSVAAEPNYSEAVTAEPPQQVTINYFESTLSPYGNWVEVADYGRCWQPTVVVINRDWRPYSDRGRWLYTSNGWYWQSDYSWGWAPFHYGRWHCDNRIGWVWVPGSTWGPSWVSWRYTDDYCGWAPLPPSARYVSGFGFSYHNSRVGIDFGFGLPVSCYTFIPTSRFCERTPSRYYVSGSHSKTIYNNSVVINNYVRGNNNTIVNEGVGRERITRATKTPVRTVALRELPTTSNPNGRAERLEGNNLTVFRPNISASTSARSITPRSAATTAAVTRNTTTANRNLRSISKTGTTSPPTPSQSAATPVAPVDPSPKAVTRTVSPPSVIHNPSAPVTAPKNEPKFSENSSSRSVRTTQPNSTVSKSLPTRALPEIGGNIERREANVAPIENPRAVERTIPSTIPQTPFAREAQIAPITRTIPSVSPIQRSQPTARETRRPEARESNFGAQNPSRFIAPTPAPAPSVSAPVQNFSAPREVERRSRVESVERSAPQISQPSRSAPEPSIRQSTPHQEAPASRERVERSVDGNRRPGNR